MSHRGSKLARRHQRKAKRSQRLGHAPGTLLINPDSPRPVLQVFAYGPQQFVEEEMSSEGGTVDMARLATLAAQYPVVWVNVDGLGDEPVLRKIAEQFHVHPLVMEDVVNLHQRAKLEDYGDRQFIVTHMVTTHEGHLDTEQLSLFLGPKFLLTFQERPGWDCLNPVRDRIRKGQPTIRNASADFLAYSLLDAVTDNYFPLLEQYGERLETIEDRIVLKATHSEIAAIHELKRELLAVRRLVWPLRDVFNTLTRERLSLFGDETRLYLRDCYDHTIRIIDLVETHREVCSDLMDLYLTSVSFRLNEVMKVLTVISALFIPLTFICSIYGMNFDTKISAWNMPELEWTYGYPFFWAVILAVTAVQLVFFWRRGWLTGDPSLRLGGSAPKGEPDETHA